MSAAKSNKATEVMLYRELETAGASIVTIALESDSNGPYLSNWDTASKGGSAVHRFRTLQSLMSGGRWKLFCVGSRIRSVDWSRVIRARHTRKARAGSLQSIYRKYNTFSASRCTILSQPVALVHICSPTEDDSRVVRHG